MIVQAHQKVQGEKQSDSTDQEVPRMGLEKSGGRFADRYAEPRVASETQQAGQGNHAQE
jgi:hypothetical protein